MKFYLSLLFCLASLITFSQIILTSKLSPAVGDSLYYAVDTSATGVAITAPGANQNWDFSQLNALTARSEVYRHPSLGANAQSFPTADVMLQQGVSELYYRLFSNRIELLGTGSSIPSPLPGIGGLNVYPKAVVVQRYPQRYLDSLNYRSAYSITFPSSILPDTITNGLPPIDSIRISYDTKFHKLTDAWGTLKLPAKTWNVLREKRTMENQVKIEAKLPFLGWLDVTSFVSGAAPGLFDSNTTYSYAFISDETKGLIALVNVDSLNTVLTVQFKPDAKIILKTDDAGSIHTIGIYPNPADHQIYFSLQNLNSGYYDVSVFDVMGKEFATRKIFINENTVTKFDIDNLPAGAYYLQISDKKKQKHSSGLFQKR